MKHFVSEKTNESKPRKQLMESPSEFQFSFSLPRDPVLRLTGHLSSQPCLKLVPSPAVENHSILKGETPQLQIGIAGCSTAVRSKKRHPGKDPERVVPEKTTRRFCKSMGQVEGSAQWDKHP